MVQSDISLYQQLWWLKYFRSWFRTGRWVYISWYEVHNFV